MYDAAIMQEGKTGRHVFRDVPEEHLRSRSFEAGYVIYGISQRTVFEDELHA
jgi:hypothetical protein